MHVNYLTKSTAIKKVFGPLCIIFSKENVDKVTHYTRKGSRISLTFFRMFNIKFLKLI